MRCVFLDESVHLTAAALLRARGWDAAHVIEAAMAGADDEAVLAEAVRRGAVLVSHDSDFHKLLAQTRATARSVIRVRVEIVEPMPLVRLVEAAFDAMNGIIEAGAAISVDDTSIRGRRLPLR